MSIKTEFLNFISDKISNINVILEIGSRDAIQSIEFSNIFPKAKVYAFECNPPSIKMCTENIEGYKNIEIVPCAVFNKNGKMKFYPVITNIGASSLFKLTEQYTIDFKLHQKEIIVDAIRIDTWAKLEGIDKIDLIWIDLQGAEYEAFEGMGELLCNVQAIYTEVEYQALYKGIKVFRDLLKLLTKSGFSIIRNQPVRKDWWGNAIFVNNNL